MGTAHIVCCLSTAQQGRPFSNVCSSEKRSLDIYSLNPSLTITSKIVLDPDMVIAIDRSAVGTLLTKAVKQTGPNTPLRTVGATPFVAVVPPFESRLDQVTGTVGHARSEEEQAVLGG